MSENGFPNEIKIFATIVERGTFIAASQALKVPKTTVSRKIEELEARLGVRLLQRTTRKLALTEAGRIFHSHCERILAEMDDAEAAVGKLAQAPRGNLKVTAPFAIGANYLARALPEFLVRYPEIRIDMLIRNDMVDLVAENIDVGIRVSVPGDSGLISRSLGAIQSIVVASPAYLQQAGTPASFADLALHRTLAMSQRHESAGRYLWSLQPIMKAVSRKEGKEEHITVVPIVTSNDPEPLVQAALAGQGIACLPYLLLGRAIASGALIRLFPGWASAPVPIHAVYPSRRGLDPKVRVFVDYLVEKFSGFGSPDAADVAPAGVLPELAANSVAAQAIQSPEAISRTSGVVAGFAV